MLNADIFGACKIPVATLESGPDYRGECAQIPPFLRIAGEIPGGSRQTKEVHGPQKDEDVTFRSLLGRHFQLICINRRPRAVNMFAHQIEGIAAFAREHPLPALAYLILFNIFLYIFFTEVERYNARIAGFKGPSGFPIIGNIWQIRTNAAEQYRRWAKEFGAVYQIQLGNVPVVVVNSAAAARTIFGQNAQALSSRPEFYTFHKVGDPFCTSISILMSLGRLQYSRDHNRDLTFQRLVEEKEKRGCVSSEQAVRTELHTPSRR
jgi:hypothetical protein